MNKVTACILTFSLSTGCAIGPLKDEYGEYSGFGCKGERFRSEEVNREVCIAQSRYEPDRYLLWDLGPIEDPDRSFKDAVIALLLSPILLIPGMFPLLYGIGVANSDPEDTAARRENTAAIARRTAAMSFIRVRYGAEFGLWSYDKVGSDDQQLYIFDVLPFDETPGTIKEVKVEILDRYLTR